MGDRMTKKQAEFDPEELTTVFSFEIDNQKFKIDRINQVMNDLFRDIFLYYFGSRVELDERITWNAFHHRFHEYFSNNYTNPFSFDYLFSNFFLLWKSLHS